MFNVLGRRFAASVMGAALLTTFSIQAEQLYPPNPGGRIYPPVGAPGFLPSGPGMGQPPLGPSFGPPGIPPMQPSFGVPAPLPAPMPPVAGPGIPTPLPAPIPPVPGPGLQQPNHSDLAKDWERVNQLSSDFLKEIKGTTNVNVTALQFGLAVTMGAPDILWSSEAIAQRKLELAKAWARSLELVADASWLEFKRQKNVCDIACTQNFINLVATMSNAIFFTRNYDMYMRWQYRQSLAVTGGEDARNGSWQKLDAHLRSVALIAKDLVMVVNRIEMAPITQAGFAMMSGMMPPGAFAWQQGQPFCGFAYNSPFFGHAYFPYYENPTLGRFFVYQPVLPFVPQSLLPQGYVAPMGPQQFYSQNFGMIQGTDIAAVPAPIGEEYQPQEQWMQEQNSYYQANPIPQGGAIQPQTNYDQWLMQQNQRQLGQRMQQGQNPSQQQMQGSVVPRQQQRMMPQNYQQAPQRQMMPQNSPNYGYQGNQGFQGDYSVPPQNGNRNQMNGSVAPVSPAQGEWAF